MRKIFVLCTVLVLILVPACVMAAGPQGQAAGVDVGTGSSPQAQQAASGTTGQGRLGSLQNSDAQMLQVRSCNQTCDQDCSMIRNMTRSQTRVGYTSAGTGESPGTGLRGGSGNGIAMAGQPDPLQCQISSQNRAYSGLNMENVQGAGAGSSGQRGGRDRIMGRDMVKNQTHLQDGSCGNCPTP
ncbi:MAG: hypothetical protein LUQ01_02230 [Methanolinea sp.]|nr:hypothetical protein [Methanolinea sp.]